MKKTLLHRLTAIAIVLVMVVSLIPSVAFPAKALTRDDGWISNNYTITTAGQLYDFVVRRNSGAKYTGTTIKLGNNINFGNETWPPINSELNYAFEGIFDGQNYTISNIVFNCDLHGHRSLFGTMGSGAEIKNLKIDNLTMNGPTVTDTNEPKVEFGLLATAADSGSANPNLIENITITNSAFVGTAGIPVDDVGGLIGAVNDLNSQGTTLTIRNCSVSLIKISTEDKVENNVHTMFANNLGGLVGYVGDNCTLTIENSSFSISDVIKGHVAMGGLIGGIYNAKSVKITDSWADVGIQTVGDAYDSGRVGGLIGHSENTTSLNITNCVFKSTGKHLRGGAADVGGIIGSWTSSGGCTLNINGVRSQGSIRSWRRASDGIKANVGGILGKAEGIASDTVTISDSVVTGDVRVRHAGLGGGFVGYILGGSNNHLTINLNSCVFDGTVYWGDYTLETNIADSRVGGVVGMRESGTFTLTDCAILGRLAPDPDFGTGIVPNSANGLSGAYHYGAAPVLTNCIIGICITGTNGSLLSAGYNGVEYGSGIRTANVSNNVCILTDKVNPNNAGGFCYVRTSANGGTSTPPDGTHVTTATALSGKLPHELGTAHDNDDWTGWITLKNQLPVPIGARTEYSNAKGIDTDTPGSGTVNHAENFFTAFLYTGFESGTSHDNSYRVELTQNSNTSQIVKLNKMNRLRIAWAYDASTVRSLSITVPRGLYIEQDTWTKSDTTDGAKKYFNAPTFQSAASAEGYNNPNTGTLTYTTTGKGSGVVTAYFYVYIGVDPAVWDGTNQHQTSITGNSHAITVSAANTSGTVITKTLKKVTVYEEENITGVGFEQFRPTTAKPDAESQNFGYFKLNAGAAYGYHSYAYASATYTYTVTASRAGVIIPIEKIIYNPEDRSFLNGAYSATSSSTGTLTVTASNVGKHSTPLCLGDLYLLITQSLGLVDGDKITVSLSISGAKSLYGTNIAAASGSFEITVNSQATLDTFIVQNRDYDAPDDSTSNYNISINRESDITLQIVTDITSGTHTAPVISLEESKNFPAGTRFLLVDRSGTDTVYYSYTVPSAGTSVSLTDFTALGSGTNFALAAGTQAKNLSVIVDLPDGGLDAGAYTMKVAISDSVWQTFGISVAGKTATSMSANTSTAPVHELTTGFDHTLNVTELAEIDTGKSWSMVYRLQKGDAAQKFPMDSYITYAGTNYYPNGGNDYIIVPVGAVASGSKSVSITLSTPTQKLTNGSYTLVADAYLCRGSMQTPRGGAVHTASTAFSVNNQYGALRISHIGKVFSIEDLASGITLTVQANALAQSGAYTLKVTSADGATEISSQSLAGSAANATVQIASPTQYTTYRVSVVDAEGREVSWLYIVCK